MDDGGSPATGILMFVILVVFDFVIFGFIAAMNNLNEAAVEKMAKEGNRHAGLLLKYTDKPTGYAHTCQLLVLLADMLLGFYQVPLWRAFFFETPTRKQILLGENVLIFAVLILLVLTFGIYTPEKVASRKPEVWAMRLVMPVHFLETLFLPFTFLADQLANLLARVFGVDPLSDTDDVTEEEIISMVNEGHEQGVLLASEAEMIHNIFEFGDKEAKDIMTHRKNIVAIDGTTTFLEALTFIKENNYSRFPVYIGDIDNIIGVLHIKEALTLSQEHTVFEKEIQKIDGLVMDIDFIPETRNINTLFTTMQAKKSHMVIVVDEYGQTSGIVAMEDILEEIVGNIEDEHDKEEHMIEKQPDGSYLMNGFAAFEDVMETLGIESEDEEDAADFETLNGFFISLIGKIPNDDETFQARAYGYLFETLAIENKMIKLVRVTKVSEESEKVPADMAQGKNINIPIGQEEETCQKPEKMIE